jgi:hypothetical protein
LLVGCAALHCTKAPDAAQAVEHCIPATSAELKQWVATVLAFADVGYVAQD